MSLSTPNGSSRWVLTTTPPPGTSTAAPHTSPGWRSGLVSTARRTVPRYPRPRRASNPAHHPNDHRTHGIIHQTPSTHVLLCTDRAGMSFVAECAGARLTLVTSSARRGNAATLATRARESRGEPSWMSATARSVAAPYQPRHGGLRPRGPGGARARRSANPSKTQIGPWNGWIGAHFHCPHYRTARASASGTAVPVAVLRDWCPVSHELAWPVPSLPSVGDHVQNYRYQR